MSLGLNPLASAASRLGPSDLAIDLGTSNTRVYLAGAGVVLEEPSVVAFDTRDGGVLAVGAQAKAMLGRVPDRIQVVRPLRRGVIADFEATQKMLAHFMRTVGGRRLLRQPRVVVTVPHGTTQVERRAVEAVARQTGARRVYLVDQPMAAALGAGLPVAKPGASMIVDIGGGTTEVAVLSMAGIVQCESLRVAGDDLDDAVVQYVKKSHGLLISSRQAEDLKLAQVSVGAILDPPDGAPLAHEVKGRALIDGLPRTIVVSGAEVREALREAGAAILGAVHVCLERTPPELAADIVDAGIVLAGGGSLLRGLAGLLREVSGLPVVVSEAPLQCVVRGAGKMLEDPTLLRAVTVAP